jgi:TetR/AcrR family transcriptional repressor of mexJK operon
MEAMTDTQGAEPTGRSARKHQDILAAATEVFLQKGYLGASMDEIAARAAVSKQTVYKHFADKEALFNAIVLGTIDRVTVGIDQAPTRHDPDPADLETRLRAQARALIASIMQPDVLQVRRLIIAEAARFPELGTTWYETGFQRGLASLASFLGDLAEQDSLTIDDPAVAANHLAGLVLWVPVNRAMFCGKHDCFTKKELNDFADGGVDTFLAAYGVKAGGRQRR